VGAFLTKVRAAGEPEQSMIQAHDLNLFVRKCEAFQADHGHEVGGRSLDDVKQYREELETILRRKGSEYVLSTFPLPDSHDTDLFSES
jgi:hypothetical protein